MDAFTAIGWGAFFLMAVIAQAINIYWVKFNQKANEDWFNHLMDILDILNTTQKEDEDGPNN